jgi:hypothetical protein
VTQPAATKELLVRGTNPFLQGDATGALADFNAAIVSN